MGISNQLKRIKRENGEVEKGVGAQNSCRNIPDGGPVALEFMDCERKALKFNTLIAYLMSSLGFYLLPETPHIYRLKCSPFTFIPKPKTLFHLIQLKRWFTSKLISLK